MSDTNKLSEALRLYAGLLGIRLWIDHEVETDQTVLRLSKPSNRHRGERLEQRVILSPEFFTEVRPELLDPILRGYVDEFADKIKPDSNP